MTSRPQLFRRINTGDPVFDELSTAEISLLRDLAQRGSPTSEARLDGDALRTLAMRRYVKRLSGFAVITPDGRRALTSVDQGIAPTPAAVPARISHPSEAAPAAEPDAPAENGEVMLNSTQEDMLRQLALAESPVPFDDLDGRVVRALEGRGLVGREDGRVVLTESGREFYQSRVRRRRRARAGGWATTSQPVQPAEEPADIENRAAQSLREAVDILRHAIGGADQIEVADMEAPADETFAALIELADRIELGGDPRRIPRRATKR
ncbi:MAG TPA: hypothetical protein VGB66_19400 [Longimicrobium sp.]